MRHSFLVGCLLTVSVLGLSQRTLAQASKATSPAKPAAEGTYQVVQLSKAQVAITTDVLTEIESRRHATQEVVWNLSPYARVRILPRSVISKPGFKPLAVYLRRD